MDDLKAIPNDATIFKASNLEVIDVNGVKVQLGSLFADEKTIVVLISESISSRHQGRRSNCNPFRALLLWREPYPELF